MVQAVVGTASDASVVREAMRGRVRPGYAPATQRMSAYACVFGRETAATGRSGTKPECCGYRARRAAGGASGSNTGRHASRRVIERFVGNVDNAKYRSGGSVTHRRRLLADIGRRRVAIEIERLLFEDTSNRGTAVRYAARASGEERTVGHVTRSHRSEISPGISRKKGARRNRPPRLWQSNRWVPADAF